LDSERKHSKRREAAQAAEPATARGDASKDYKMGGFATRRFKGTKEIDEAATAALAAAHSNGTDGLTDDAATHFLLQALAAAGDIYATMQQDALSQPPHAPPTESPQAPTLPRYDRHPRPPHLNEDHEALLHEENKCSGSRIRRVSDRLFGVLFSILFGR
jgi:hypothetical protein